MDTYYLMDEGVLAILSKAEDPRDKRGKVHSIEVLLAIGRARGVASEAYRDGIGAVCRYIQPSVSGVEAGVDGAVVAGSE